MNEQGAAVTSGAIPADFIDKRLADPMWNDGWYYGWFAALDEVEAAVTELRRRDSISSGHMPYDQMTRGGAFDDLLAAISSLRSKEPTDV